MSIALQDGKSYRNGRGVVERIGGRTRDYPDWVWSISGFWYVRATGQRVGYRRKDWRNDNAGGEHYIQPPSSDDLIEEVQ